MERDPIENTEKFQDAMRKIQPQLDELNSELDRQGYGMSRCHIYWARKKELLKNHGVDWKTPSECNPHVIFD